MTRIEFRLGNQNCSKKPAKNLKAPIMIPTWLKLKPINFRKLGLTHHLTAPIAFKVGKVEKPV
jgi:hypothetical protein